MRRVLWTTLLTGLMMAATGSTVAVADGNPRIVIRPIFASDISGQEVGPAVGLVTFNTETGDWTVSTRDRLPLSDANIYYPSISLSQPSTLPGYGRFVQDSYFWVHLMSVDGVIEASGTVTPWELDLINQALANRGVFLLATNSI